MEIQAYLVKCITNMHAGSGDASYGIIDKLVQRDPVTQRPCIYASSLKGALREHFEIKWKDTMPEKVDAIFGKEGKNTETGEFRFLGADLVALPVRCNFEQYVLGISKRNAVFINDKSYMLLGKDVFKMDNIRDENQIVHQSQHPGYEVFAEDFKLAKKDFSKVLNVSTHDPLDRKYAIFKDDDFTTISQNLPVIARNCIEDGTSANLWYEEVVPHQTVFITYIFESGDYKRDFDEVLENDIIQMGANATIGYGLCKFYKIELS